jgi:hypothetical protein
MPYCSDVTLAGSILQSLSELGNVLARCERSDGWRAIGPSTALDNIGQVISAPRVRVTDTRGAPRYSILEAKASSFPIPPQRKL